MLSRYSTTSANIFRFEINGFYLIQVKAMYSLMSQICNRMTDYINNRITDKPEFEAKDVCIRYV